MRSNTEVVRSLIDGGYPKSQVIVCPRNRCPVTVIGQADFDEFRRECVAIFEAMEATASTSSRSGSGWPRSGSNP